MTSKNYRTTVPVGSQHRRAIGGLGDSLIGRGARLVAFGPPGSDVSTVALAARSVITARAGEGRRTPRAGKRANNGVNLGVEPAGVRSCFTSCRRPAFSPLTRL